MVRKYLTPILIVGALGLVAVFGAMTYQRVFAQETNPTPTTPSQQLPGKEFRGERMGQTEEDLANALGITVEKLDAAKATAAQKALEQAVQDGLITQEQADQLSQNGLDGRHGLGRGVLENSNIDPQALLAEALGISVDQLKAAQQKASDTALARAVSEGALTQEEADMIKARQALYSSADFQSTMKSAFEAGVAQAVKSGLITQAQADQILKENAGKGLFRGPGFEGPGFGGPHGGRHGGPGFDTPPDTQPNTDTSNSDL